jgi:hypothetical protein
MSTTAETTVDRAALVAFLGKSKTAARRTISALLKTLPIDTRFSDKWLQALVQYHPSRSFPASQVVFALCARAPFFTLSLFVEARTGGLVDCSWVKCVANLYGKYDKGKEAKQKALAALRNEAFLSDMMQEARQTLLGSRCARCGLKCRHMVVDHSGKPFAEIVDEFLAAAGETLGTLKVRFSKGTFRLRTRAQSKAWRAFHDAEATLEGLCNSCNCSLGSRGYRHSGCTQNAVKLAD